MKRLLQDRPLVLMEAAINERLRRSACVQLHPNLVNAPLIYDPAGREALARIYGEYMDIAAAAELPLLLCTPTWRADRIRVSDSDVSPAINTDAAGFMQDLRDSHGATRANVRIGGLLACKNDCYRPSEGLSATEAEQFHGWQIEQLARGGVDFLLAETLPNVQEALGIARAMQASGLPYVISFVIGRDGRVLDGTGLPDAVDLIDAATETRPLGYMVNCAYPSFLSAAQQPATLYRRLIGYQANASSLDHCDLDGAADLAADSVSDWGDLMLELNRTYGVQILGGCCGTSGEHLRYLVDKR
jgi:S-methylmethionine-dependent homocysteine/selenocysteine methylase